MRSHRNPFLVLALGAVLAVVLVIAPVSLASAASVTGTLRDHAGSPVPDVTLRAENNSHPEPTIEAETGADGSYQLSLNPGNYTLSTFVSETIPGLPPGWALETAQFSVAGDETRDITLPQTATVTVEALGVGDAPIPGATVDLAELVGSADLGGYSATNLRSRELRGVTDANGHLAVTVFDDGTFTEQGSIAPEPGSGYGFARFSSPPVSGDTTIVVRPPATDLITGTLRDHSGNPLPSITLRASNVHAAVEPDVVTETGADGSYALSLIAGNSYTLSTFVGVAIPGLPPGWALQTAPFDVSEDQTRDITLPQTATVTVEALGDGGAPVPGAHVDLSELIGSADLGGYTTTELRSRELTGFTDQDGRLSLTVFDHGTFREEGSIMPPIESGFSFTRFPSPAVNGDTKIVVDLAGKPAAPVVTGLAPNAGPEAGGSEVTISGSGFTGATEVRFGSTPAAIKAVSSTSIVAVAPAGTGQVDVTVKTPNGTSTTSPADRFAYGAPVSLSSSPNPSKRGQKVTFTAKVTPLTPGAPAPTGTVAYVDNMTVLATVQIKNGKAKFSTKSLKVGKHQVTAVYGGDSHFGPSNSKATVQVVKKARKHHPKRSHRGGGSHRALAP